MRLNILAAFSLIVISVVSPARSFDQLEVFGYFESQLTGADIDNEFIQLNSNKLRIDLKSELSDNVSFGANFDYITYHGKTDWEILRLLPPHIASQAPDELVPYYMMRFDDRQFLDNAFLKLAFDKFDLTVGKQQIATGTGYAWNPTDLMNTKDLLDPTYENPGVNALRLGIPIASRTNFTAVYLPEDNWDASGKFAELKTGFWRFDFALTAMEREWIYHDFANISSDPSQPGFKEKPERRRMGGLSTVGELLGFGVWSEYAYNFMALSDDFYELVAGLDYTFDFQTYFMLEFYRNSLGKADSGDYDINDWMRYIYYEQRSVARDQIYAIVRHPVTDFIDLGLSTIYVISDGSAALIPTFEYSIFQDVSITAYLNFYTGDGRSVNNPDLGNGGMVRLRVYF